MKNFKFIIIAVISNIFWTILSLFLGFYFGTLVLNSLEFVFQFITFLLIYGGLLYFVYRSFRVFYYENHDFIKRYALYNLIYVFFIFLFIIGLFLLDYFGFRNDFNLLFNFCYFNVLSYGLGFIPSLNMIFGFIIATFIFLMLYPIKHRIRLLALFMWGIFFGIIFTLIFMNLIYLWFNLKLYISIIFLTILMFYFSILIRESVSEKKIIYILDSILVLFLFIILLVKFALSGDFYLVILSFMVAVLECELIIILSHYEVLDKYLARSVNKQFDDLSDDGKSGNKEGGTSKNNRAKKEKLLSEK